MKNDSEKISGDANPYQSPQPFEMPNRTAEEWVEGRYKVAAAIISCLIYAVLIGVLFDPGVQAVLKKAFGEKPFGLPVAVVVGIGQAILYLPALIFFWHFYVSVISNNPARIRRSRVIYRVGMAYAALIVVAWILYTEYLEI